MNPANLDNLLIIGGGVAGTLGVLLFFFVIRWHRRKARPARPRSRAKAAAPAPEGAESSGADTQASAGAAEARAPEMAPPRVPASVETAPGPESPADEAPASVMARRPAAYEAGGVEPSPGMEARAVPQAPKAPPCLGLGLRKTREGFLARLRGVLSGAAKLNEIYAGLEEALIAADVGVETSLKLTEALRARLKNESRPGKVREALEAEIAALLEKVGRPMADPAGAPLVIMVVGVNGAGKTTTVAKLAARFKTLRGPVVVAAADTFRAAAIEQLEVWCKRAGAEIIKQKHGSDPAAVAFDAVKAAVARKAGTVIIDTAGRLHTKVNLMEELKKIARVAGRELDGAPHETWLVLDATTGQNALSQARIFTEAVRLTGVVLTKLDSTAKGGVVIGIAGQLGVPVRFVGLGESIGDLNDFDAREFVEALFENGETGGEIASGSYAA